MSRAYETSYTINMTLQNSIYNDRVCSKTEEFYNRYKEQYNAMLERNFDIYIPNEMNRLKEDLDEIKELLASNSGNAAREESLDVGSYIHSMFELGKIAKKEFERRERLEKELKKEELKTNKSEAINYYYEAVNKIKDPIVRDFAKPDLIKLKGYITSEFDTSKDLLAIKDYVDTYISKAVEKAEPKANEWKQKTIESSKIDLNKNTLSQIEEELKTSNINDNNKKSKIVKMIEDLKNSTKSSDITTKEIHTRAKGISKEIDSALVSEDVRKETVKAIVNSLKAQGFSINNVDLCVDEKNNFVKVVAKKPSGKKAMCAVGLDGKLKYKFDNYHGMACVEDIDKFNVDLKDIYSINLSNEKVIWENPIRISKDSKEVTNTNKRGL